MVDYSKWDKFQGVSDSEDSLQSIFIVFAAESAVVVLVVVGGGGGDDDDDDDVDVVVSVVFWFCLFLFLVCLSRFCHCCLAVREIRFALACLPW